MKTGSGGVSAISWSQTEIDGLEAAPLASMAVGAAWSWRGRTIQLNHSAGLGQQGNRSGRYMSGTAEGCGAFLSVIRGRQSSAATGYSLENVSASITITNGARSYTMFLVETEPHLEPLLVFDGGMPPRDQDFWIGTITRFSSGAMDVARAENGGIAYLSSLRPDPTASGGEDRDPAFRPVSG